MTSHPDRFPFPGTTVYYSGRMYRGAAFRQAKHSSGQLTIDHIEGTMIYGFFGRDEDPVQVIGTDWYAFLDKKAKAVTAPAQRPKKQARRKTENTFVRKTRDTSQTNTVVHGAKAAGTDLPGLRRERARLEAKFTAAPSSLVMAELLIVNQAITDAMVASMNARLGLVA